MEMIMQDREAELLFAGGHKWSHNEIEAVEQLLLAEELRIGLEPGDLTRSLQLEWENTFATLDICGEVMRIVRIGDQMAAYLLWVPDRYQRHWTMFAYQAHWNDRPPTADQMARFIVEVGDHFAS